MQKPKKFIKSTTVTLPVRRVQFPNISLSIPEHFLQRTILSPVFLTAFTCGFLFMAIGIIGFDIKRNLSNLQAARAQRSEVEMQINYWKGVVSQYQGYRDGYYQLALLEYQVGNTSEAYKYNNKALNIDPAFKEALQFAEKINKRSN